MKVIILGGGLAGLSAAYSLNKSDVSVTVLEAENQVGGLTRSYTQDGFTYDLGPHRFHTQDTLVLDHFKQLMDGNFREKIRKSRILLYDRFFDYPLRVGNAILTMPPTTTAKIVLDYIQVKLRNLMRPMNDDNFENWVVNRFGWQLYEIYFKVYTEKTWGLSCTKLNADWAAQRISLLSLWDTLIKTLFKSGETPRTYVNKFYYPKRGGVGAISKKYAQEITEAGGEIKLNTRVNEVRVVDNKITQICYGGETLNVGKDDIVFSTIPITDLINSLTPKPPSDVLLSNTELRFRSIVFVYLMFKKDRVSPDHWIYLPELKYLANRVSEAKNFSEENTPEDTTIVGAEITCQKDDDIWNSDKDELSSKVLEDMVAAGLVKKEEYFGFKIQYLEHAYPIYDLNYRTHLKKVLDYLKQIENLRFFGRNGLFRYNNMDHSISMGLTAAKSISDKSLDYMKVATEEQWFG